jgi:hypothetical protein
MKKLELLLLVSIAFLLATTTVAHADHFYFGYGYRGDCCWGRPYGYYPYPPYYPPPAVVYETPPTVIYQSAPVYASPPTVVYQAPEPGILADQTSPTFIDSLGRTCRKYESGNQNGTACEQTDGIWRTVQ